MANRKVSHFVLALALLASATAVSMMPFSYGGGMMGMGGRMGMPFAGLGYKSGRSISSMNTGTGTDMVGPVLPDADRLIATQLRQTNPAGAVLEGINIIIKPVGLHSTPLPAMGLNGIMGGGLGMGHGLMGSLGGMYGGLNMGLGLDLGHHKPEELETTIEIILPDNVTPFERFLVFTEFAEPGLTNTNTQCLPAEQGAVLTGPVNKHSAFGGALGYAGAMGFNGGSMGMLGNFGHMGSMGDNMRQEFGVMATLNIQGGTNRFNIKGLGPFTKIEQLAGRGALLCEEVVISINGRPACADVGAIPISFCQNLAFNNDDSSLPVVTVP